MSAREGGLHTIVAVLAIVCAAVRPANARDCEHALDQATLTECAEASYRLADHALEIAYAQIESRLADDPVAREWLAKAQEAWVAYRNAECSFSNSGYEGGTIHPQLMAGCKAELTQARLKDLNLYLDCQDGDPGCPVPPAR